MGSWGGWLIAIALGGCAAPARPTASPLRGLAPAVHAVGPAVTAIAPLALAPAMAPMARAQGRPRGHAGVAALPLGDGAVVRALSGAQPSFLRCFRRAQRLDPALVRVTVTVLARLAATGQLEDVRADAPTAAFGACVLAVTRGLRFAPPPAPVELVLPLRFAAPE